MLEVVLPGQCLSEAHLLGSGRGDGDRLEPLGSLVQTLQEPGNSLWGCPGLESAKPGFESWLDYLRVIRLWVRILPSSSFHVENGHIDEYYEKTRDLELNRCFINGNYYRCCYIILESLEGTSLKVLS